MTEPTVLIDNLNLSRSGRWVLMGCVAMLAACQSAPLALWQTASLAVRSGTVAPPTVPGVRFMKVSSPSGVAYMVLGDQESLAGAALANDPVQVWYSAGKQVVRLHEGRVAGTAGLPVDWRSVRVGIRPSWDVALKGPVTYLRERDEMPGYRFQVMERVTIRPVEPPAEAWAAGVPGRQALAWFTEEAVTVDPAASRTLLGQTNEVSGASARGTKLPAAWFAVDMKSKGQPVVFSRQCLAPDFCLEMEPMPTMPPSAEPGQGSGVKQS